MLTVAQISDLHIIGASEYLQGIDVRANFLHALYSDSVERADFIMLSGDLADCGEEEAYRFIFKEMEKRKKPWSFIPGNHDTLKSFFNAGLNVEKSVQNFLDVSLEFRQNLNLESAIQQNETFDYLLKLGNLNFACLDTTNGNISENQKNWLKQINEKSEEFYLFTHYPPCLCGHAFMDSKFSLKNIEQTQLFLKSIDHLHFIFSGHYHTPHYIKLSSLQKVYVAPSTQMQISPHSEEFLLLSDKPSWQIIEFTGKSSEPIVKICQ